MNQEYVSAEDYKRRIPDGEYQAQCLSYDNKFVLGKTKKLFLHFKIIDPGPYHGVQLFLAFNMPYSGRVKQGSKYYKTWAMVNGWSAPSRNAKMSPRIFLKKLCKIKTRTVKPLHNNKPMPENFWYSVVDGILKVGA